MLARRYSLLTLCLIYRSNKDAMGSMLKQSLLILNIGPCYRVKDEYDGSAWDELKHIRHAVNFLIILQKSRKSLDEIHRDLCPMSPNARMATTETTSPTSVAMRR